MRKNRQVKNYERLYLAFPDSLRKTRTAVACPLKTVYINTNADDDANVDRLYTRADDLGDFLRRIHTFSSS